MPTSDLLARYKDGQLQGGMGRKQSPIGVGRSDDPPGIVAMLSKMMEEPILNRRRFEPGPAPVPLGQAKRRPYQAADAARPSIPLGLAGIIHSIPANRQFATKAREQRQDILSQVARSQMSVPALQNTLGMRTSGGGGGSEFNRLVSAIAQKESGGNYRAINPTSGATGKYQIMPGNIGPWSREILGRTVSRQEFLNSPQLQDAIALGKLRQYYQKYGAAGAATAWYAGPGAVSSKMGSTKSQGQYPSINAYWNSILRAM